MKGIVFTEFLEHVETSFGLDMVQNIIDACDLTDDGAYTSVGTYPCQEMGQLVGALSRLSGQDPQALMKGFGERLGTTFHKAYPQYFDVSGYFDFVESVDAHIHVEVKKLYPDAELPKFESVSRDENSLVLDYVSSRGLEDLAAGLLMATASVFDETISIHTDVRENVAERTVRFTLERC